MRPARLLPLALLLLAGCAERQQAEPAAPDTVSVRQAHGGNHLIAVASDAGLTTFHTLVKQAGWEERYMTEGPWTVFAPSDEAFQALPEGELESLLELGSRDRLRRLLDYHTVPREILSAAVVGPSTVQTLAGRPLRLTPAPGGVLTVTDESGTTANVFEPDHDADNGVVHGIDAVLVPGEGEPEEAPFEDASAAPEPDTAAVINPNE